MSKIKIKIKNYELRPVQKKDLEWARVLHNDPTVLSMLTDPTYVTPKMQKKWYQNLLKFKKSQRLVALYKRQRIGVVRIDDLDFNNRSVCIGLDIHRDSRGKGLAKNIYLMLFRIFFDILKLNRCWLFVAEYNEIARKIYKDLGFVEEGRAREALRRFNKYNDYILMSILRKEYKNIYKKYQYVN